MLRLPVAVACYAMTLLHATPLGAQGSPQDEFWRRQMQGLSNALGSSSVNSRVRNIWFQLVRYSGMMRPVLPAQNFTMGQALPNGIVLLDLSVAGDVDTEVTAFWLGHEYGHQAMGHPQLSLTQVGRWMAAQGGTAQEDAADRYSARFLRAAGYRIEPVLRFLCDLPGGGPNDSHSDGRTRARNVAMAFGASTPNPCAEAADEEEETFDIAIRIWSRAAGNPSTMTVSIDGDEVGTLSNLDGAEELPVDGLKRGPHSLRISDITVYGPYGVLASGLECSSTFLVTRTRTMRLTARLLPSGEVMCRLD